MTFSTLRAAVINSKYYKERVGFSSANVNVSARPDDEKSSNVRGREHFLEY
jgi:hypothetical protein